MPPAVTASISRREIFMGPSSPSTKRMTRNCVPTRQVANQLPSTLMPTLLFIEDCLALVREKTHV
jgi:hypothetical protein